jgi:hypothetical protein
MSKGCVMDRAEGQDLLNKFASKTSKEIENGKNDNKF